MSDPHCRKARSSSSGRSYPREMEQGVQQHRGVAGGEHEAVAVGPGGIARIVAEEPAPQHVRHRGQRHRRAGMSRLGRLDRVHRQRADRVDAAPGEVVVRKVGIADGEGALAARVSDADALCRQTELLLENPRDSGWWPRGNLIGRAIAGERTGQAVGGDHLSAEPSARSCGPRAYFPGPGERDGERHGEQRERKLDRRRSRVENPFLKCTKIIAPEHVDRERADPTRSVATPRMRRIPPANSTMVA